MISLRDRREIGKAPRPSPSDADRLKQHFGRYLDALIRGKFSEAIGPRNDLAEGGIEVLFQRRKGGVR